MTQTDTVLGVSVPAPRLVELPGRSADEPPGVRALHDRQDNGNRSRRQTGVSFKMRKSTWRSNQDGSVTTGPERRLPL